jgi:RNA polymerase sigma-70 factor (ECF subfamily)
MTVGIVLRVVQPAEDMALDPAGIRRLGEGRAADRFDALFHAHYPRVAGMLARLMGDRGQAEEIAADTFCKLARQRSRRDGDHLVAWVYRVAMHAGLDAVRSNARRKRREEEAGAESLRLRAPGALEQLLQQERCARVQEVLAALKPRDAQLLLLRASGLAYRELAQSVGIQAGSVGTLLARAEAEFERRYRARYGDSV